MALLVGREHQAVRRRVEVEADEIAQFGGKLRVAAELEYAQPVWGEAMGAPDLLHDADRQPHRPAGPQWVVALGCSPGRVR